DLRRTIAVLLDDILQRLVKLENKVDYIVVNGSAANTTNGTSGNLVPVTTNKRTNKRTIALLNYSVICPHDVPLLPKPGLDTHKMQGWHPQTQIYSQQYNGGKTQSIAANTRNKTKVSAISTLTQFSAASLRIAIHEVNKPERWQGCGEEEPLPAVDVGVNRYAHYGK
ncbi:hypothetical protein STEG23_011564, partial [Scotinomys teguina]